MELGEESLHDLVREVRRDFQIPPYFEDEGLIRYAKEGEAYLLELNPGKNIEIDHTYRMLLKNYMYYAYHHIVYEWEQNYASLILKWQLESEVQNEEST